MSRDSRVLAVTHRFTVGYGGIPESLLQLAGCFSGMQIGMDVISYDGLCRAVGELKALPHACVAVRLRDILSFRLEEYRCVFVAGAWNPIALAIAMRARWRGIPVVYAPKGNLARAEFKRLRDLKKFPYLVTAEMTLLWLASRIVFSSRLESRSVIVPVNVFSGKSVVIPELFSGGGLRPEPAVPSHRPLRIGFLAEIAPRKGLLELVSAFVAWRERCGVDVELVIAGEPRPGSESYLAKIKKSLQSTSASSGVLWLGAVRESDRAAFYQSLDLFICPSRFESFGLTLLEALWCGSPVIASSRMGVLEFMPENAPVIRLSGLDPQDIQDGLDDALARLSTLRAGALDYRNRRIPRLSEQVLVEEFAHALFCGPARAMDASQ